VERKGLHHRNHTHTTDERGALFLAIGETRLRNWVGKRGTTSRPSVIIVQELVNSSNAVSTSGSDPQPPKKTQNLGGNLPLGSQIS
jgi:hypothetical protein